MTVHQYDMSYYLAGDIYPKWTTFVKSINPKESKRANRQEACMKDIELAFRVLQARFTFVEYPTVAQNIEDLARIMNCCICLHNMIIEDERHTYLNYKEVIK